MKPAITTTVMPSLSFLRRRVRPMLQHGIGTRILTKRPS
ncbi:hypothetical protein SFOMI_5014 [Sphingobium fuliginis]|uniref:Uncharacterized protein n=1 Tax=Sphingobium fuliginis (strain ATCC 27551) TaxID=336203 RepID=A0A292ZN83_SPHSA|nr:hypothetical protein SFOMI_5014 [Sphingobium fuliginis]